MGTDNERAQQLYRQHGFTPAGIRRGYYQPSGADALVMRLLAKRRDEQHAQARSLRRNGWFWLNCCALRGCGNGSTVSMFTLTVLFTTKLAMAGN